MRRVAMSPCPPRLEPNGSPGADEEARAIAHFDDPCWRKKPPFKFSVYQHDEVRDALLDAFADVCAYCEAPVASIEVEHYRPKSEVQTETGPRRPGYYWLAARWENLLPSCHECNTQLRSKHADGVRRKSGKGTRFPLADEHARATGPGEEVREAPLLLHPYFDDPAEHLAYGEEAALQPRCDAAGVESARGDCTIRVLGLNRRGLFEARRDRALVIAAATKAANEAERHAAAYPGDAEAVAEHRRCIEDLARLLRPDDGFAGMAAQLLELSEQVS